MDDNEDYKIMDGEFLIFTFLVTAFWPTIPLNKTLILHSMQNSIFTK